MFIIGPQVLVSLLLDCLLMGIVLMRFARSSRRANTIVFSDKAVIRKQPNGTWAFQFQVMELRRSQLIESHMRIHALHFTSPAKTPLGNNGAVEGARKYLSSHMMRVHDPSDEVGAFLLMCVPQLISHTIDFESPLKPQLKQASSVRLAASPPDPNSTVVKRKRGQSQTQAEGSENYELGDLNELREATSEATASASAAEGATSVSKLEKDSKENT